MDDQNKNLILASVLSFLVILVWFIFFPPTKQTQPPVAPTTNAATSGSDATSLPPVPAAGETPVAGTTPDTALADAPRIGIKTDSLTGSISLLGGRIDTLSLNNYRESLKPDSGNVQLLSPIGTKRPYYALFGWAPAGDLANTAVPGPKTLWSLESGTTLSQNTPVTIRWDNGAGLIFHRTLSVDDQFMFRINQSVDNTTGAEVRLAPYGIVARHGKPAGRPFYILHEGVVRQSDNKLEEIKYSKMPKMDVVKREGVPAEIIKVEQNGWVGFTDKYWMTTLIPDPGQPFTSVAKYVGQPEIYQVESRRPVIAVAPGASAGVDTMLFAGAKKWKTIRDYQNNLGIKNFVDSIDWGWFFFLTKPIFRLLHFLHAVIGNMGWSIIALTFLLKALLFPLAYKSYVSMARMKELQPVIEKLKERTGGDRQKLQQEMMALYKKEKVNPASGCLPILLQIPIFFSLYKVIFVTIELRQTPWIGWIRDLSAPDPSSILNLFGLLPNAPPAAGSPFAILSLGALPILLGISMFLQQKLNPAPTDAAQKMIFAWMPWVFMFMLGRFASGLVLYWITNNTITFTQQYIIMRSQGYKPDVLGNILGRFHKSRKPDKK